MSGGELKGWRDPCRAQSRLDQLAGRFAWLALGCQQPGGQEELWEQETR